MASVELRNNKIIQPIIVKAKQQEREKMYINTKHFGKIDLDENKIIIFPNGIMGFEQYKRYTILFDAEDRDEFGVSWLQSIDEEWIAIPVVNPYCIKSDYNPVVEDELLIELGEITEDNLVMLVTLTVPTEPQKATVNLKAPFIINAETKKGCQMIAENLEYDIKCNIYEAVAGKKQKKGDS